MVSALKVRRLSFPDLARHIRHRFRARESGAGGPKSLWRQPVVFPRDMPNIPK